LTLRKSTSQKNLKQTTSKFARLANEMKYDAVVEQVEDQIKIQRKQTFQLLKMIKSYLMIRKRMNRPLLFL